MKIIKCRICSGPLKRIFSLGNMPIVNYYLSSENLRHPEDKYPLRLCLCTSCGLAQIDEAVESSKLFLTYHYASSTSRPLKEHLEGLAEMCRLRFGLNDRSTALDIGCNDGVLLARLRENGVRTLGVDPAENIVEGAKARGVRVITSFFGQSVAAELLRFEGPFDMVTATNSMAQVIDVVDFVKGISTVLRPDGVFVAEVGYVLDMVEQYTFDAIYHEHLSYFGLASLAELFERAGLEMFDAERIDSHGGSLRVFARRKGNKTHAITDRLRKLTKAEKEKRLDRLEAYGAFAKYVADFKRVFRKTLLDVKRSGARLVGVGAPAKSVILLNYCGIDDSVLDFIVDSTPYKQYRFMPGVHIPVYPEDRLSKVEADYYVLLAWTYREELVRKLEKVRKPESRLIVPFPQIEVF